MQVLSLGREDPLEKGMATIPSLGREDPLEKGMATIPVFLPGEFHGQRSLVGYSPWGHTELSMTDVT